MSRACALIAGFALAGCRPAPATSPEEAYAAFVRVLREGDARAAYDALSAQTRKRLEGAARSVSQASGGAVRDDPALLTFATGFKPEPLKSVRRVSEEKDRAEVEADSGAGPMRVPLVREEGRWKVELSGKLNQ